MRAYEISGVLRVTNYDGIVTEIDLSKARNGHGVRVLSGNWFIRRLAKQIKKAAE